ncbi:origin recognition complex subunit 2 [Nematocida sp. ERTm5]|nr:origin recognition complex subunit 2 [Nematocida sp. ERTm5]
MDLNSTLSKKLLDFHRAISNEYHSLLEYFNLYIYGYGYKIDLVKELFPDIFIIDFQEGESVVTTRNLYEYYELEPVETELKQALRHINALLTREKAKPIAIMNLRKDVLDRTENLKMIVIQHRELYLSFDELLQYNFVMRDFTTFIAEEKKRPGISTRIDETLNVYDCVGVLSKKIFKLALKAAATRIEFSLRDIFNKEKKKLLIVNYSAFREALSAFIDSNILVEKNGVAKLTLTKKELSEIIGILDGDSK